MRHSVGVPLFHNATHGMSHSCALVPRLGAVRYPRLGGHRSAHAGTSTSFAARDRGRVAAKLRVPPAAKSASRVRSARWGVPFTRPPTVLRAQDQSKSVSSLSLEGKEEVGVITEAVEVDDVVAGASSVSAVAGDAPNADKNHLPDDDARCAANEQGDEFEVCVMPFGNDPSRTAEVRKEPTTRETRSVETESMVHDFPTDRAAALMSGALLSDDAVIASTLGATPDAFFTAEATQTNAQLWWRALKLPMYSVALAPLTAAAALTHHWFGCFHVAQFCGFLGGACLVIAWLNLSNDAWDAGTGVDGNNEGGKPESVVNLLGGTETAVKQTHAAAVACLVFGFASLKNAIGFSLVNVGATATEQVVPFAGAMLALAVALGHAYQGPPFRLSYKGLGEPICFAAFGPLSVGAFYLLLASGVPSGSVWTGAAAAVVSPLVALSHPGVLGASFLIGSTTTSILFASHLHQEQGDKAAGKMSPVVRLGVVKAVAVLRKGLLAHQLAALVLAATGLLPIMGAVGVLTVSPLALMAGKFAGANAGTPEKLFKTKYLAVRWHVAHLLFLALGIWLDPWMPWCWNRVAGAAVGMRY